MVDPTPMRPPRRREPRRPKEPTVRVTDTALTRSRLRTRRSRARPVPLPSTPFEAYQPPPGVVPKSVKPAFAMDESFTEVAAWAASSWTTSAFAEGVSFLGYSYLAELAQRPEYRVASEVIAQDCTREWIELTSTGDEDKSGKIKELEAELTRLKLQKVCQAVVEKDGQFGRAHIYLDTGQTDDKDELKLDIGDGHGVVSQAKIGSDQKLTALRVVEPMWAYPQRYESTNPLSADWYNPTTWYVMSQEIHRSRFLTVVGRPVPDILKPAYAFGGLSMSQMMKPYVDNWLRTRQAVSDIVAAFVVNVLKTQLGTTLQAGGDALFNRVDFFNAMRDNHNTLVIDKESEDWTNVQTSLASLDLLQAQSQEHLASVTRVPLVKLLGIQPAGLNASSEGEIKTYDDTIHAYQEKILRDPITVIIGFAQLSLWGEVDPGIGFNFKALRQLTEKERAELEKIKADTDDVYLASGVVQPEDVQRRIAADEDSPYHGLELTPPAELSDPLGGVDPGAPESDDERVARIVTQALIGERANDNDSWTAQAVTRAVRAAMDAVFQKAPKEAVGYEHPAQGPYHCGQCQHYEAEDHGCHLVQGAIEPEDWCKLFEAKDEAR